MTGVLLTRLLATEYGSRPQVEQLAARERAVRIDAVTREDEHAGRPESGGQGSGLDRGFRRGRCHKPDGGKHWKYVKFFSFF